MQTTCKNKAYLALMQTSKEIQECIRAELAKTDLHVTEFSVLEVLYFHGKQTIHEVAQRILVSSGSMTYVIDKLERKHLLQRVPCPDDRRVIHLVLTREGEEFMQSVMPGHQERVEHFFGSLSEEESGIFIQLLGKIKHQLHVQV
ncbi:MarR family 2-MHQ and catechol resistance regulon transcriptional repressor [Paenibacillus rhizosphaerae]|uniref:MarR family 2-MHQ and catechol resistance regulon transcriptional repressor n=1 Tax=Paenibacillus rhizosphaerae TaxID=297318 RepID=A0A839TG16_9BACL|nr:MarR family transcriptional regulator [Paenibacillus rhizosphaerae]MBB3125562.1 MarR family 2-MHQ and catechol resistance regulon transcriptional repressor [Paenibacillus rhizosphaerae]